MIFIRYWYVYDRCSGGEVGKSFRQLGQVTARPFTLCRAYGGCHGGPFHRVLVPRLETCCCWRARKGQSSQKHEIAVFGNLYCLQPSRISLQPIQLARLLGVLSNLSGGSSLSVLCCAKLQPRCQPFSERVCRESSHLEPSAPSISQNTSFQGQFASSPSVKTTSGLPAPSSASSYSDRTLPHASVRACLSCFHTLCPTRAWFSHTRAVI